MINNITDPILLEKLIEHLEQFVTEPRKARLQEVLANRTRNVTVVLEDLYQIRVRYYQRYEGPQE